MTAGTVPAGAPADSLFTAAWDVGQAATTAEPRARVVRAPMSSARPQAPDLHPDLAEKVVLAGNAQPLAIEQYRRLTAKLHHAQLERHIRRLMVISALANEGKTLTSVNIALTLTHSHKRRVLLIDTDLRRPSLHEAFCVAGDPGLREAIERPSDPLPIVAIDERLSLLPGGKPTTDPIHTLTSDRTRQIISESAEEYDWVVIDTAPLALLPDANVLADAVDAAILVIAAGQTPHELATRAIRLLGRERILGVVLNGVDPKDINAAQYYSHYYQRS